MKLFFFLRLSEINIHPLHASIISINPSSLCLPLSQNLLLIEMNPVKYLGSMYYNNPRNKASGVFDGGAQRAGREKEERAKFWSEISGKARAVGVLQLRSAQLNGARSAPPSPSLTLGWVVSRDCEYAATVARAKLHGRNLFWSRAAQSIRDFARDAWKFMIFSFVCSAGRSRGKFIRCTLFKNAAQRHGTAR